MDASIMPSWYKLTPPSLSRRDFVRVGALSSFGLTLPMLLDRRVQAGDRIRAKSCILIWLDGGPSHLETFDLKPEAPAEVRGPFSPIKTIVPGIEICELLPGLAKQMHHCAIIRSMTSPLGEHGLANQYMMTGYKPSMALRHPSLGSMVSHQRSSGNNLPDYISIKESAAVGSGYLPARYEPFVIKDDPAKPDFRIQDMNPFPDVDPSRLGRRIEFLRSFDGSAGSATGQADEPFAQAMRLLNSPQAKQAFHLDEESVQTRDRYGVRSFGQGCLLARRLVERGVSFVTVNYSGWDTHDSLVLSLKLGYSGAKIGVGLLPTLDQGLSSLINDLADRNLLNETLIVVMGEFGRTPKLNTRGGRDHWPRVFSVLLAGGGVRGGQYIGASDRTGESPSEFAVTPADLAFSIYSLLGIDPQLELRTGDGRPVRVNQDGKWISGLS